MQSQHALNPHRWTSRLLGFGIYWLDDRHQIRPRHHAVHLVEKPLSAGRLAILFKRDINKCLLVHELHLPFRTALPVADYQNGINQSFLSKVATTFPQQPPFLPGFPDLKHEIEKLSAANGTDNSGVSFSEPEQE